MYSQVTCHTSQRTREYRTGEFVIIKVDRRVPPMLLHIQCVVQDRDGVSGQVRGLLYARPDDTPHKRQHYHGEVCGDHCDFSCIKFIQSACVQLNILLCVCACVCVCV